MSVESITVYTVISLVPRLLHAMLYKLLAAAVIFSISSQDSGPQYFIQNHYFQDK